MKLLGKSALFTGTSRGIGPAIAIALAAEGAQVLCYARKRFAADTLADELGGVPIVGDLSTEDGLAAGVDQTSAAAPVLHVLVHNAAINPRPHESVEEVERDVFRGPEAPLSPEEGAEW
jgi:NAD(P)-dependent dehydrogenase (short-subunit alcohol dehydrogenase family)